MARNPEYDYVPNPTAHAGFATFMVSKYYGHAVAAFGYAAVIQAAHAGLVEAAGRYDSSHNAKFVTYAAWYIKKHVLGMYHEKERSRFAKVRRGGTRRYVVLFSELGSSYVHGSNNVFARASKAEKHIEDRNYIARKLLWRIKSKRSREIIVLRFGLRDGIEVPVKALTERYGVGKSRMDQIISWALMAMRSSHVLSMPDDYTDEF